MADNYNMIYADILYSEELDALAAMLEAQIRICDPGDRTHFIALGHLHIKLTRMRAMAPSMRDIVKA